MTITEYKQGDKRSGGFVGLRVNVQIGIARYEQYFTFKRIPGTRLVKCEYFSKTAQRSIWAKARNLESQWLVKRTEFKEKRDKSAQYPAHCRAQYVTGIKGLTCGFRKSSRNDTVYFIVRYLTNNPNRNKEIKQRTVTDLTDLPKLWRMCTSQVAGYRGYDKTPPKWNRACPTVANLKEMLKTWEKRNHVKAQPGLMPTI